MAYEIEIDGQRYMVDGSGLDKYVNPETGELTLDVFANDIRNAVNEKPVDTQESQLGMDEETAANFQRTNQELQDVSEILTPRGSNFGGAARNFAMGAIPGAAEAEAVARASKQKLLDVDPTIKDKSGKSFGELYDMYLQNARESRKGYAIANPQKAMALQLAGGVASSLAPFGVAAKATTLPRIMGRGALTGTGLGAAFGFGNAEGGFENRLASSLKGGVLGGTVGGLAPLGITATGAIGKSIGRFRKGFSKEVPQESVDKFILSETLSPTIESRSLASKLGYGSTSGAKDIERSAYELLNMKQAMNGMINPNAYVGKTGGGTTAKTFLKSTQSPSLTKAKQDFGEFVEAIPTVENPTRTLDSVLNRNETARRILGENSDSFVKGTTSGDLHVMNPGEFEYWQRAEQILNNKMPKKYNPSKLTGEKKDIYDAIQQLSSTREKLFPGTNKINAEYASAVQDQRVLDKQVIDRLRVMSGQQKQESISGGVVRMLEALSLPAYNRGVARELVTTGKLAPAASPKNYQVGGSVSDAVLRILENIK